MGAEWDRDLPSQRIFDECLRVLKPGGHIFVMSSERLDCIAGFYHLLANAGFEVDNHQLIGWLTLSGMPKSSDVAKTADKEAFRAWLAFVGADLSPAERRKAESAAVNGDYVPSDGANRGRGEDAFFGAGMDGQPRKADMPLLTRLLASHWPASPAEQRAHWEAVVPDVPADWDCSRPPGVRVKTGRNERTCIGPSQAPSGDTFGSFLKRNDWENLNVITAPSTPDAVALDGWRGSVAPFKPMLAPILHACKPWRGSYLDCARESGGGVLNVEAGRIPFAGEGDVDEVRGRSGGSNPHDGFLGRCGREHGETFEPNTAGRVPGNLLSYGDLLGELQRYADLSAWCKRLGLPEAAAELLEAGLVYAPKPSRAEKEAGLEEFAEGFQRTMDGGAYTKNGRDARGGVGRNTHPTAKPVSLCAYLITLCTREGQTVLDPFTGSGSTGVAAAILKRRFVGVELSEDFAAIARARIAHATSAADDTPAQVSPQPALMEVPA